MLCPCGCGHLASESHAPENEGMYEVGPPTRCHARTALDRARDNMQEDTPQPAALMFDTELRKRRG